jgi:precorrin-6A/cobalt-precorrin-6A reductase
VLLLGGTGEARELAGRLVATPGLEVVSSLAGRVTNPRLPAGAVRIGGFGGVSGLAAWLRAEGIDVVVDATHPFASRITGNAVEAAAACGLPLLLVRRPGWQPEPGDDWRSVGSLDAAAELVTTIGGRVFLTIGRQGLARFAGLDGAWFLIRCVDPPGPPLPARAEIVVSRGPFTVDGELELMRRHRIDVVVTKDSGGAPAAAKLSAARVLGLPVVMVRRPPVPSGVATVETVDAALAWAARLGPIPPRERD